MEHSTKCPTVLLKADTVADVNLINLNTFNTLIWDRTVLQPTALRIEAYGNNMVVEVLGKFHAFLRWKGRVYRQHDQCQYLTLFAVKGWLLHFRSIETLLLCEN